MRVIDLVLLGTTACLFGGCVLNSTYGTALKNWEGKLRTLSAELEETQKERDDLQARADSTDTELAARTAELGERTAAVESLDEKLATKDAKLKGALTEKATLTKQVTNLSVVEKRLALDKAKLENERQELAQEVKELRRLRAQSEARSKEYKRLLSKLHKMIDAGSLEVKFRNGMMLVALPSDVLFPVGQATLKPEAIEAIKELARTLKTFKGRRFQIIGHSDSTPINTEEWPSNWHLSSARAHEVLKVMIEGGVSPKMLSFAGSAEFDPVARNNSSKNKARNRRVELVFVPKIDELPGISDLLK